MFAGIDDGLVGARLRRRVALGWSCAAVGVALTGCAAARASSARPRASVAGQQGDTVAAHTLPGDHLLAGPVLVQHQAVWVEAGIHRLVVRALKLNGRTRTVFSTSAAPGAPNGARWPFEVGSLAASNGRVAFVDEIMPCASSPPRDRRCVGNPGPPVPPDSVALFAGRLGAIRRLQTVVHPRCAWGGFPRAVTVAPAGLVVDELAGECGRPVSRLVLMSFSGRPLRQLMKGPAVGPPLAAAGDWVAYMVGLQRLRIMRISSARLAVRLQRKFIGAVTLDRSGAFAFMAPGPYQPCGPKPGPDFAQVTVGSAEHHGMHVLAGRAVWGIGADSMAVMIAGTRVVYGVPTGHCLNAEQVVIGSPGGPPRPVAGFRFANQLTAEGISSQLVFDGRVVATDQGHTIELAAAPTDTCSRATRCSSRRRTGVAHPIRTGTLKGVLAVCCNAHGSTPERGVVRIKRRGGRARLVHVGGTGHFSVQLRVGVYDTVGGIPSLNWKLGQCRPERPSSSSPPPSPIVIRPRATTRVWIVCAGQ